MEFIDSIIKMVQTAEDPTPYYLAGVILVIVLIMMIRSLLHTLMLVAMVGVLIIGGMYFTGNTLNIEAIISNISKSFNSASSSASKATRTADSILQKQTGSGSTSSKDEDGFLSSLINGVRDLVGSN